METYDSVGRAGGEQRPCHYARNDFSRNFCVHLISILGQVSSTLPLLLVKSEDLSVAGKHCSLTKKARRDSRSFLRRSSSRAMSLEVLRDGLNIICCTCEAAGGRTAYI